MKTAYRRLVIKLSGERLAGPGGELRFRRDGPFWRFVPESQGFADRERVQTLLAAVTALAATRFVDDRPADLSRYGLKPPHAVITCSDAGGERTVLLGGRADRPGELYARPAGAASVAGAGEAAWVAADGEVASGSIPTVSSSVASMSSSSSSKL